MSSIDNLECKKPIKELLKNERPLFNDLATNQLVENNVGLRLRVPTKTIARISICDAVNFEITDIMKFSKPTDEQIQNLYNYFNIRVTILNNDEEKGTIENE